MNKIHAYLGMLLVVGLISCIGMPSVNASDPTINVSIENGYVGSPDSPDMATVNVEVIGISDVLNYTNFTINVGGKEGKIVLILHGEYNAYDHYYEIKFIPPKVDAKGEYDVNVSVIYNGKIYSYVVKNGVKIMDNKKLFLSKKKMKKLGI